ncbi:MAG: hypothetical protein IV094_14080 [Vitreoscilla sp.]|nr:hypothetical protein [Vitreoscilla sp.]
MTLQPMGGGVWWAAAADGDADPANRGVVSNRLVVRDGARVWLLGSGPSPAAGAALACALRERLGWRVTDVVNPWARPELVLGNPAFPAARLWAHAEVAVAMRDACARCEARLRQRLGAAAADLGDAPIRVPTQLMQGDAGRLGPFDWWRLLRAAGSPVVVFRIRGRDLWVAQGLLWADGPPDLRDAELHTLRSALARLEALAGDGEARWMPEQGAWLGRSGPRDHGAYLQALTEAVRSRQAAGAAETDAAPALPGLAEAMGRGTRPALNWQRAWRQLEDEGFGPPRPASSP